jgi:hypothetical protein
MDSMTVLPVIMPLFLADASKEALQPAPYHHPSTFKASVNLQTLSVVQLEEWV